jgi:hypothetical protein
VLEPALGDVERRWLAGHRAGSGSHLGYGRFPWRQYVHSRSRPESTTTVADPSSRPARRCRRTAPASRTGSPRRPPARPGSVRPGQLRPGGRTDSTVTKPASARKDPATTRRSRQSRACRTSGVTGRKTARRRPLQRRPSHGVASRLSRAPTGAPAQDGRGRWLVPGLRPALTGLASSFPPGCRVCGRGPDRNPFSFRLNPAGVGGCPPGLSRPRASLFAGRGRRMVSRAEATTPGPGRSGVRGERYDGHGVRVGTDHHQHHDQQGEGRREGGHGAGEVTGAAGRPVGGGPRAAG